MADARIGISLIGESAISSRIHERLPRHQFRVRAYSGARSKLRNSPLVDEFVPIGDGKRSSVSDLLSAARGGAIEQDDWLIWGTDQTLEALRNSDIPLHAKLDLLPAKTTIGLSLLGSKVGLADICSRFEIPHPRSTIAHSVDELVGSPLRTEDFLVKGDSGGGGSRVRRFSASHQERLRNVPEEWFPVVVQEFVNGRFISVEALFRDGQLSHYLYSEAREFTQDFGWSRIRQFRPPFSHDFVQVLAHLGETCGLHGFANCSFIWDEHTRRHLLIEADMRPNAWHQFGPNLGIEWAEGLRGVTCSTLLDTKPHREAFIHHFPREIVEGIRLKQWAWLMPWLRHQTGTWEWRQRADSRLNWHDWRTIARALVVCFFPILFRKRVRLEEQSRSGEM